MNSLRMDAGVGGSMTTGGSVTTESASGKARGWRERKHGHARVVSTRASRPGAAILSRLFQFRLLLLLDIV